MRLIAVWMICALLAACEGPTAGPEEALRQWLADAEAAAEDLDSPHSVTWSFASICEPGHRMGRVHPLIVCFSIK